MDAYQPPPQYMRPPPGPPPPTDPYHQYYQHQARPPVPPSTQPGGPPAWYPNQFHNPHSPSPPPPPPPQWGPPSPHYPQGQPYSSAAYPPHQPPFHAGANGNSPYPPPPAGAPIPPPYPQANQEWGNPNWGYQQGHNSQANSNVEDWAVKAKEWAAANKDQQSQSAPNQSSGQVYQQQYSTQGFQDVHQQAVPGVSYQQQFSVPPTAQPERYPSYSAGNESYASAGFSHQENLPTSSAIHQQEVPYSYSSVAGKEESGKTTQHEVQLSVPDSGGPVHAEQHMQYAYGDQTASNLSDQPVQFATRESSDYASVHNAWQPHAATGVVYPPMPSSVPSIPQHESSMAIPSVSGHTMPPYGGFPPPNLQPVVPPYNFGTKPPLHPVAAFMDDSYAASSVPPKKAPVPNWLKEELLKKKADLGRPSSGSFEERESMDEDRHYKPPSKADQRDEKNFSLSKSSDEEEEEDEDEIDAERTAAINMEIKRILTEVLLKVTDELFDEIATKVINEDQSIPKADPPHKASANILVSVEGANKKPSSGSPADVLGLASYASDADTDADTDAASNEDADENDGVESLGVGSRHSVSQHPSTEKLPEPEAMANAKLDPEVEVNANSGMNNKSGSEDNSQMLRSRRKDYEAGSTKISDVCASSGLDDDTSKSRKRHPDRTDSDRDAVLDEPHRKYSGLKSDCNLHQDINKTYGKDFSDDLSKDVNRIDETKSGKEKVDSQNGSKGRMKQGDIKTAEKVKGVESNKKSTDPHVKKDAREVERPHRTSSKEDRGKKREKEKEEERSRHRQTEDSSKEKRRRSPTSNGSSDDSTRKSRSRRRNVSPSPVRSRRKRSSPSSDESSDDAKRKSSSRRRNRSPSPGRSRRRHVSSRSPHSKHSQHKNTLYSSHDKSRSKRSRSRSPHRRHRAK
ncbi:arginine/serine-rich protein PNISR isoform X2 [Capsella rubella]|uniref:arginine/serine-rich protein PNISR isoform X2 n=1 Tax=Capsella rubella TaxID=81985 RepID=UPI000CD4DA4E|nr:arginine/serine-rich protein PNISR isoform X2 [Capsella rubella]